jgi:hypothetical protein
VEAASPEPDCSEELAGDLPSWFNIGIHVAKCFAFGTAILLPSVAVLRFGYFLVSSFTGIGLILAIVLSVVLVAGCFQFVASCFQFASGEDRSGGDRVYVRAHTRRRPRRRR